MESFVKTTIPPNSEPSLRPRKTPKQLRSIALVAALKAACLDLLAREGEKALSLNRLSEISGVSVVSIYEYFPTIDALIAAVLQDERQRCINEYREGINLAILSEITLHEFLLRFVKRFLRRHLSLWRLHTHVYTHHIEAFDFILLDPKTLNDRDSPLRLTQSALMKFRHEIRIKDLEKATFLMLRSMQLVTRALILERPDYLEDPETATNISDMLHGLLT